MKRIKIMSNALCLSALGLTCTLAIPASSCSAINKKFFTVNGKDLQVTFCDRGASIYSIKYKDNFVTYHPADKETFMRDDYYYGKTLGRVTGRFADGILKYRGHQYQLEVNEHSTTKNNSLHGGKNSLTTKDFAREVKEEADKYTITFKYNSPALEAGYPEKLDTVINYIVYKNASKIELNIKATSSGVTPVNITNHPYFRLGNDGDILQHTLHLPTATQMGAYDMAENDQTVTGLKDVAGTPYDFTTPKAIGTDIRKSAKLDPVSNGYDHVWYLGGDSKTVRQIATLTNPANKISLKVSSDADGLIMYANCYPHDGLLINDSFKDSLYSAITVEPYTFFTKETTGDNTVEKLLIDPQDETRKEFNRTTIYELSQN